eukprot:Em0016g1074a
MASVGLNKWRKAVLPSIFVRHSSTQLKRGTGGRSSFSGIVATVFGATGFYGRYIVNRLGRVGSQVVIPYRGDEHDYRHLRPMGDLGQLIFLPYNLRDTASIEKALKYSNVVINLVGRDYETRNFKFEDTHVTGARAIADAARRAGVSRLVHFSALNASKDSPSKFLQTKALGEEAVKDAFPSVTIVRPSETFGHEDRFFNFYAKLRALPLGLIPLVEYGFKTHKMPLYVGDIAGAVANIISDPSTAGNIYELTGPNKYLLYDLVEYLYRLMYRPFRPVAVPELLMRFTAFGLEQSPFIPHLTRDILTRMYLSNVPTPDLPGLEDLGIAPTPVEDKCIAVMRRYRGFLDYNKPVDDVQPIVRRA